MSYTKNTWQTGDTVTAEKLNHMEDGIAAASGSSGGGVLVVNLSENYVCDKTAGEMLAAMETVGVVIKIAFPDDTTIMPVIGGYGKSSGFGFGVETDDGILHFTAETENGYPVLQSDGGE